MIAALCLAFVLQGAAPVIAVTPAELDDLRAKWRRHDKAVTARIARAGAAIRAPLEFPPRGGQHNQWYQCDACQLALVTKSPTRHVCPRCKKVYSGWPYDDVVYARVHGRNMRRLHDAAWAFAITGKARFKDFARRVLLGYAKRYRDYPYHSNSRNPKSRASSGGHLEEQTLGEASMLVTRIAPAYDLVAAALTPDEREAIRSGLLRPMVENIAKCKRGKSNWQTWHNAAMLWGGAVLGDKAWIDRAIHDSKNGFEFQMRSCLSPDGMWFENSWSYHFYTLRALVELAEGARRIGIDLWKDPRLGRMFTLPLGYVMADGSLPRFGDAVDTRLEHYAGLYAKARAAIGVAERPAKQVSHLVRGAGHALLFEGDYSLAFTFGAFGGFHGHFDKLSFVLFGRGRELGVDPGRARSQAYRLPIHRDWYRATLSHNAVVAGGRSQRGTDGELLAFERGDGWTAVAATCTKAYRGVRHTRLLVLAAEGLAVIDDLRTADATSFDWIYHGRGTRAVLALARDPLPAPELRGAEYVHWSGGGRSDRAWNAVFEGKAPCRLGFAGARGTTIRTGDGPGASILDRVPLVVVSRHGTKTRFAAALTLGERAPVLRRDRNRVTVDFGTARLTIDWDAGYSTRPRRLRVSYMR